MKKFPLFLLLLLTAACASLNLSTGLSYKVREPKVRISLNGQIFSVDLETYVAHVLAGEVSPSWPQETLKAQAICARTFALKNILKNKNKPFDVHGTVKSQVFAEKTKPVFIEATKQTKGMALYYKDHLAEAFFHSTCGGQTASAKSVWGQSIPYLTGKTCPYCQESPSFTWKTKLFLANISQKLGTKVNNIAITKKEQHRVLNFAINNQQNISGQNFRMKIGPMVLKSTYITSLNLQKNHITITGKGFGHGVGLCQYGAKKMGKLGKTFKDILAFYYPDTKIVKYY